VGDTLILKLRLVALALLHWICRVQNGDLVRFTAQEELRRLKIVLLTHEVVEDVSRLLKWFWTISPMLLHDTTP
jgi:hypothetical protein